MKTVQASQLPPVLRKGRNIQPATVETILAPSGAFYGATEQTYWTIQDMPVAVLAWKIRNRVEL